MTDRELRFIADTVKGRGGVLEIGTYCGLTTRTLLKQTTGLVFSVDPLHHTTTIKPGPDQRKVLDELSQAYPDRFIFIPGFSQDLIWRRPIDVLLIDGDHGLNAVRSDLDNLAPYVRPGGVLILDDWYHGPVNEAWRGFQQDYSGKSWRIEVYDKLAAMHRL